MMNGKCFNPLMMDGDGSNLLKHLRGLPPTAKAGRLRGLPPTAKMGDQRGLSPMMMNHGQLDYW